MPISRRDVLDYYKQTYFYYSVNEYMRSGKINNAIQELATKYNYKSIKDFLDDSIKKMLEVIDNKTFDDDIILYRGSNIDIDLNKKEIEFKSITSTTTDIYTAEMFAQDRNLFIMHISKGTNYYYYNKFLKSAPIKNIQHYYNEEEYLLKPQKYKIIKVERIYKTNLIYLSNTSTNKKIFNTIKDKIENFKTKIEVYNILYKTNGAHVWKPNNVLYMIKHTKQVLDIIKTISNKDMNDIMKHDTNKNKIHTLCKKYKFDKTDDLYFYATLKYNMINLRYSG